MSTRTQSPLRGFVAWIQATDDHASHHLKLVHQAELALARRGETPAELRRGLAQQLDRWRYQHFNEHSTRLTARDEALIDALDMAANDLADRPTRSPRATRHAIADQTCHDQSLQQAVAALDPGVPLDQLVGKATELTDRQFRVPTGSHGPGKTSRRMLLYAPLYVSNDCVNYCTYCGFRYPHDILRKHLTIEQALEQAQLLRNRGFRHLLVVAGDFPSRMTTDYYVTLVRELVGLQIVPAVEIAAQSLASYAELARAGVWGLTLYQETYDQRLYAEYHPRGPKSSFHWRLEAPDRAAEAGIGRLGLGVLLGLADPRQEMIALMRHGTYLARRFPRCTLALSLPRIHEAPAGFQVRYRCTDEDLIRLYCALRLAFPRAELVLSTREAVALRDRLARICITQMSAGSSTAPGGYEADGQEVGQQFPVVDQRSPAVVAHWLRSEGFKVVWKTDAT